MRAALRASLIVIPRGNSNLLTRLFHTMSVSLPLSGRRVQIHTPKPFAVLSVSLSAMYSVNKACLQDQAVH